MIWKQKYLQKPYCLLPPFCCLNTGWWLNFYSYLETLKKRSRGYECLIPDIPEPLCDNFWSCYYVRKYTLKYENRWSWLAVITGNLKASRIRKSEKRFTCISLHTQIIWERDETAIKRGREKDEKLSTLFFDKDTMCKELYLRSNRKIKY